MEENQCERLINSPEEEEEVRSTNNNSNTWYFTRQVKSALRWRNDLFLVLLVLCQNIQSSWAAAAANVMVQSELSDGQFSRWISLDNLKFKETSLTLEAG